MQSLVPQVRVRAAFCFQLECDISFLALNVMYIFAWLEELHERTVRIFRPARTASQQGKAGTKLWKVDFDILEGGGRWENPLMGWASRQVEQADLLILTRVV